MHGITIPLRPEQPAETAVGRRPPHGGDTSIEVVIVGAGFGGLETAKALARSPAHVTIIDEKNHHCFQPLLYQVATASLSAPDVAWPIRSILSRQSNVDVVLGRVVALDTEARTVTTAAGKSYRYDYLVIASGATHSYFDHPEWSVAAPGLKTIEDATAIRSKLLLAFENAEAATSEAERNRNMTFVIIGGGPTGVELAGSISDIANNVLSRDFRHIDPREAKIILIEAGPRILPSFPEPMSAYARSSLQELGVDVQVSKSVVKCDLDGVTLSTGSRIEAGFLVWAAGVRASPAADWLGIPGDKAGRIPVNAWLEVNGRPGVFAIGDTASARSNGKIVPGVAPAAKQMGQFVGRAIGREINGKTRPAPFRYRHQGDLAAIGRGSAIASFKRLHLTGVAAWFFWGVVHIFFLIGRRSRMLVAINWLWEYITRQRGARLISRAPE